MDWSSREFITVARHCLSDLNPGPCLEVKQGNLLRSFPLLITNDTVFFSIDASMKNETAPKNGRGMAISFDGRVCLKLN